MTLRVRVHHEPGGAAGDAFVALALRGEIGEAIARGGTEEEASERALAAARLAVGRGVVSATLGRPRRPRGGETYREYLRWHGVIGAEIGFAYEEIVRRASARHLEPERHLWASAIATLRLAIELRTLAIRFGARGLVVAAAYRPLGGASDSRHKANAAIDLDLLAADHQLGREYLRAGARIYASHAHLGVGVGSYHPAGVDWTRRIHLDACTRQRRTCWQIHDGYVTPPAILTLAKEIRS